MLKFEEVEMGFQLLADRCRRTLARRSLRAAEPTEGGVGADESRGRSRAGPNGNATPQTPLKDRRAARGVDPPPGSPAGGWLRSLDRARPHQRALKQQI